MTQDDSPKKRRVVFFCVEYIQRGLDEPFEVEGYEIQYPGDPNAAPEMVYHCRCHLSTVFVKYPRANLARRDNETGVEGYVGGALKQSINYVVDMASKTVTVGTALMYAIYVELGTGIFAENGDGRQTPWVWRDQNGKYHFTRGFWNVHSIHLEFFCKE